MKTFWTRVRVIFEFGFLAYFVTIGALALSAGSKWYATFLFLIAGLCFIDLVEALIRYVVHTARRLKNENDGNTK